jgi:hypothetical protein
MLGVNVRAYERTAVGSSDNVTEDERIIRPRRLAASPTH